MFPVGIDEKALVTDTGEEGNIKFNPSTGELFICSKGKFVKFGSPSVVQRAVVDILPHSNTGPGDKTKGILDWNVNPIIIVLAPGVGKFIQGIIWSFQYKPGTLAYIDTQSGGNQQYPSLTLGTGAGSPGFGAQNGIADFGLDALDARLFPSLPVNTKDIWASQLGGTYNPGVQKVLENKSLFFTGFGDGIHELTTGNGSIRISVLYTIEDLL